MTKQNKETLKINDVTEAIKRFQNTVEEGIFTRYRSWAYCYKAFQENWKDKSKIDFLSLHLGWFLASWGMLRGSSFLINFDYKVHHHIIGKLTDPKFAPLYENANIPNYELVEDAKIIIQNGYGKFKPTKTLVTKILLGIFACAPAYDRFFTSSARKYRVTSGVFSIKSLKRLWAYYDKNKLTLDKLGEKLIDEGIVFPPMKLLDMALFQMELEAKAKEQAEKRHQRKQ